MTKAEDEALAHSYKYGSGPVVSVWGHAPLSADPYGIYPGSVEPDSKSTKPAESANKKES